MHEEKHLYEACRILFGPDILLSSEFLQYLQIEGVAKAFRSRALETHPDRAAVMGVSRQESCAQFESLTAACETLKGYISSRDQKDSKNNFSDIIYSRPAVQSTFKKRIPFCRYLYKIGVIEWSQIVQALTWQKTSRPRIGELGVEFGFLDKDSVIIILKQTEKRDTFGLTARRLGLLTDAEVRSLLHKQQKMQKKVGQFFVENNLLSYSQLDDLLKQCEAQNRRHLR